MFAKHPDIAKRWADKYGVKKNLPNHVRQLQALRSKKK